MDQLQVQWPRFFPKTGNDPKGGPRSLFHHIYDQPGLRSSEKSKAAQTPPEGNQDGKERIAVFSLKKRLTNTLEQLQWRPPRWLGLNVKETLLTTLKKKQLPEFYP